MAAVDTVSAQSLKSLLGSTATALSGSQTTSGSSSSKTLDMDAFLTMFTTQLKYQDPTNPLESYELSAQLAQFSTVEQLTKIGTALEEMQSYLSSLNNGLMVGMIGKQVEASSNALQLSEGEISKGTYDLGIAANVTVKIYTENGTLVRTINVGSQDAGSHEVEWDGKNDAGEKMSDGRYVFAVEAVDADGNNLDVSTKVNGTVYSLRMENGIPYLVLGDSNGLELPVSSVLEITGTEETA